ncbi:MAG: hypothetical protein ABI564_07350 [Ideonella sp.]
MRNLVVICIGWFLMAGAATAAGNLVVIVNPGSGVEKLTQDEAINIFMGRYRKLPSGIAALPFDEDGEKAAFYRALVAKELPEIQSYWSRLVFSGQGSPPRRMESADEVIEAVINNKGAIGYIDRTKVISRVRVVLELPR